MKSFELTHQEQMALRLEKQWGRAFTCKRAAGELRLSPERIRQVLIWAKWKLEVVDCLPIFAVNGRTIKTLRYYIQDPGYHSLEGIAESTDYELLQMRRVGKGGFRQLRALAKYLCSLPDDHRKRALELLGCAANSRSTI